MTDARPGNLRVGRFSEFAFAAVILFATFNVVRFFVSSGYLPAPFFDQSLDTFMDWYNTVYWGYRPGTYDEWGAVYPPFAFLFMKLFSTPACYDVSAVIARDCDPVGVWAITFFTLANVPLLYREYRKADKTTAIPRTFALGLGIPALFAWERGNVIVPCFTFFILAHGRTVRSTWLRWVCFGVMANLKPYLILSVLGRLLNRKWRWVEGCAIMCILIYTVSFTIFGRGNPFEIISNTLVFSGVPNNMGIDYIEYATTYFSMLDMIGSQLPLMHFIGSQPIELVERIVPWVIKLGDLGAVVCLVGAALRPATLSSFRLAALSVALFLATSRSAGGYAELFLLFFVFFEKWKSPGQALALLSAYVLCIPWDFMLVRIIHAVTDSYLSGRAVGYDFGLTLGAVVRPGLILLIEYGLVAASLTDLYRARGRRPTTAIWRRAPGLGFDHGARAG